MTLTRRKINEVQEDLVRIQRSFEHSQSRAKLGSWEFDPVAHDGWWSRQMYRLFDFDPNAGTPTLESFLELVHPDDRHLIAENQQLLTKPGQTRTITYRSDPKRGSPRYFEETVDCLLQDGRRILAGTTQDVTDHKKAAQEIREFELAVDNAMHGISRLDCEGRYVIVKPEYARMLGYQPRELIGRSWKVTVPVEDREMAIEAYLDMLESGRAELECRALRKDGSIFYKQLLLVKTYDDQGKHDGHYCFMRDITGRKSAEVSLLASRQQLAEQFAEVELLYRTAPVGLCLMDTDLRYVRINERLASINGLSVSDHIGRHLRDVLPDIADYIEPIYQRVIDTGEPALNFDVERADPSNPEEILSYLVHYHPLWDAQGSVIGVSTVVQDITQRRRTARELALRQEAVANSITPTAFGDSRFLLTYANQAFLDLFGFDSADQVIGMPNTAFYAHPVSVDEINEAMLTSGSWNGEIATQRTDGTPIEVVLHATLIRDRFGKPINSMVTFWDVTDRKRATARLAAQKRQQAAVAQLGLAALQETSIDQLMNQAVELVAEILNVQYSKILELDDSGDELLLRWGVGWRDGMVGHAFVPTDADSQAGYTLNCNAPVVVKSLPQEVRFQGPELLLSHGAISGISVVIHGAAKPFGVLGVHTTSERTFEEDDVNFLQSVANVLANAVRNRISEETLRESERSLAKAQQIARVGSWELDLMTGQVTGSAEMYRIIGLSPDATPPSLETFIEKYVYPDDREDVLRSHQETLAAHQTDTLEFRLVQGSGGVRHVRAEAEIASDSDNRSLRIIGTLQDISEQKKVESALRESELKFRVLTERSPVIVLIARGARIVYCNPMLASVTGYSMKELQDLPFLRIIDPEYRDLVADQHRRRLAGEQATHRYEIKIVTKHGQQRWLDLSAQLIDFEGAAAVLVACIDITDRKLAELKIWEMDAQLAHVSRLSMMGEMVAGIAHEINQPLSAIANFAAACRNTIKRTGHPYDVPIECWLDSIKQQAVRCGDIIRHLRSFVRKEGNQRTLIDLNAVVSDSIALISSDFRLRTTIDCRLPAVGPNVYANHVQIQQVLVNLLRNACEAARDQEKPSVVVTIEQEERCACVIVQDNGPGVPESERDKLFDAFYTTKPHGMGMGLAVSKSIMDVLDGRLAFEPATPLGAKFIVKIPLNRPARDGQ